MGKNSDKFYAALAEAWKTFQKEHLAPAPSSDLGSIGAMRDDDELDEIVADAMKRRREESWRDAFIG